MPTFTSEFDVTGTVLEGSMWYKVRVEGEALIPSGS